MAVDIIVNSFSRIISGIRNKERPILTLLFLGPTGTGKTELVKLLSEVLFGSRVTFTRINGEELSSEYTSAKLLGSPPGYVGAEVKPLLCQKNIDKAFMDAHKNKTGIFSNESHFNKLRESFEPKKGKCLSLILFDEIEKAHPKIWTSLLGIMDDGHLILSNNEEVDFTNSIIIMTTNVGSSELDKTLQDSIVGFNVNNFDDEESRQQFDNDMHNQALEEAKSFFPPEFCNRFDTIVPFRGLRKEDIKVILHIHIEQLMSRLTNANKPLILNFSSSVIDFIVDEGFSPQYGARELRRVIRNYITDALSALIATDQLVAGDRLNIIMKDKQIKFVREARLVSGIEIDVPERQEIRNEIIKSIEAETKKRQSTTKKKAAKRKTTRRKSTKRKSTKPKE